MDDLNVIAIMDDAGSLKKCIKLGMGISILSRATVVSDAKQGKLLIFHWEKKLFCEKLYIVYSPVRYLSEPAGQFLEFLKNYYQLS